MKQILDPCCGSRMFYFDKQNHKVPLKEVLQCAPVEPVFGNRQPKRSKTHWLVFFKTGGME